MKEGDGAIVAVLKWAVNPNLPTPTLTDLDHERLIELAHYHRIVPVLISRLDSARPTWFPVRLLTRLRLSQLHTRQYVRASMAAAREITSAMRARGLHPPIIVKGFTAHAMTGHPDLLYVSGDIDPFAEDLPAFWEVAQEFGYEGKRKDTHEWAKMVRGDVVLDVHQYYPVNSYPEDARTAPLGEMKPGQHPGCWRMPTCSLDRLPNESRIRWADLAAGAAPGAAQDTQDLVFPSPALMCLIHCAHCFRISVTRLHYMNPDAGLRLLELLNVQRLMRLPHFDVSEFRALTDRFLSARCRALHERLDAGVSRSGIARHNNRSCHKEQPPVPGTLDLRRLGFSSRAR